MSELAIQDYAVIGDCRSAALVSKTGSIDWLCWPRFDSPALFSAILDQERGGRFRIGPAGKPATTRRYLPDTNVLETRFTCPQGVLVLQDFMPVSSEQEKKRTLLPDHEILRIATCERGEVEVEIDYDPRPHFGASTRRLVSHAAFGLWLDAGPKGALVLRTDARLQLEERGAHARVKLAAGERLVFQLTFTQEAPAVFPPLEVTDEALRRTVSWWQRWVASMRYEGPYREAVIRSALTLRLLIYAPSGAVVAAPTTSLPEQLGGDKNWDYRYCWLRDASFTVRALFGLGFHHEAEAFVSWLLHTTRLTRPRLDVLYDVYGEAPTEERELPLSGYRGSRPVRVGNAAKDQLQLDVYGEVIDAVAQYIDQGGALDKETAKMIVAFGHYVCESWELPDEGIWEVRSGRYPHVHSRVLCWTALDRLIELHRKGHVFRAPEERFVQTRRKIRDNVLRHGWNSEIQSFVQVIGTDHVDATLLLLPWYGFEKATSWRMHKTYQRIRKILGAEGDLLYRYATLGGTDEGAYAIFIFWAAEFLARGGGSVDEARRTFEDLLRYGGELGLFAEEVDPASGEALGNFPQGFTHVGLINAALAIHERMQGIHEVRHHVLRQKGSDESAGATL